MRNFQAFSLLFAFSVPALSIAIRESNQTADACTPFDHAWTTQCWYHAVPIADASIAIKRACQQLQTCIPGEQAPMTMPAQGKAPGVTAQIRLGKQCGNAETNWGEVCEAYFGRYVDNGCGGKGNTTHYYLGYAKSQCDGTFLGINYGG
ncbi:hypothetical protein BCR34DRAFT_598655 [Clohesyomyces aquaticus]|uniref:Uncharacterized protein n=1 Tax=Clohesyomyces aquaticus TaxID=1231657 RepID=A0A1Y1ZY51_9PLEO|nr:hypothetical protein BCR34DRAFT_598655 [Clohesyomyces aquaticus]